MDGVALMAWWFRMSTSDWDGDDGQRLDLEPNGEGPLRSSRWGASGLDGLLVVAVVTSMTTSAWRTSARTTTLTSRRRVLARDEVATSLMW